MGLEQRGNHSYYYRKRREGGRVVSEYVGRGEFAEALAALAANERTEERKQRATFRAMRAEAEQLAGVMTGTEADVRTLVTAALLANGFYQHKRQWRKRSMQQDILRPEHTTADLVPVDPETERRRDGLAALRAAMAIEAQLSTKRGGITEKDKAIAEREKRAAVRKVLADYPCIWDRLRHVLSSGERAMIEAACGGSIDSASGQLMAKSLHAMRNSLGYEAAPLLEQLMIEQVVVAWAHLEFVQLHYAKLAFGSHTTAAGTYWDRRLNGAQARYLRASEALARVRRLAQPMPLQVNIGGQQVNVAGSVRV